MNVKLFYLWLNMTKYMKTMGAGSLAGGEGSYKNVTG